MAITNMQGVALWQLAHNLGHEWAGDRDDRDAIKAYGWEYATAAITARMQAENDEFSDARNSLPAGLRPATAHTTGTGRLSWFCRTHDDRRVVQLEVNRPAPGLRGSNSVVLRLSAQQDPANLGAWILADCECVPSMIELRHIQSLSAALYVRADALNLFYIVEHIGDATLRDRLEPEIQEQLNAELEGENNDEN